MLDIAANHATEPLIVLLDDRVQGVNVLVTTLKAEPTLSRRTSLSSLKRRM